MRKTPPFLATSGWMESMRVREEECTMVEADGGRGRLRGASRSAESVGNGACERGRDEQRLGFWHQLPLFTGSSGLQCIVTVSSGVSL